MSLDRKISEKNLARNCLSEMHCNTKWKKIWPKKCLEIARMPQWNALKYKWNLGQSLEIKSIFWEKSIPKIPNPNLSEDTDERKPEKPRQSKNEHKMPKATYRLAYRCVLWNEPVKIHKKCISRANLVQQIEK